MKDFMKKSRNPRKKHIEDLELSVNLSVLCKFVYLMLRAQLKCMHTLHYDT